MNQKLLRLLPSVHVLLETPALTKLIPEVGQEIVVDSVRKYLDNLRCKLILENAENIPIAPNQMADQIALEIQQVAKPVFRKVINATGIVLHTNLGRSPMAPSAAKAAHDAACGYLNLEVDIETGKRSTRQDAVRKWICKLLECESGTVVNN
ncbi:MAG: L-seryl-tRNA(Sec) selenium transferase, partial [Planctomycetia bacterium]